MTPQHAEFQIDRRLTDELEGMTQAMAGHHQGSHCDVSMDPVEAYFECITTCSLDDGECITTCTELLREQV
jgi:hypothetical protein